jgi:hypothetical protein
MPKRIKVGCSLIFLGLFAMSAGSILVARAFKPAGPVVVDKQVK